jgi:rsbT co-antagonist protein RsbR
MLWHNLRLRYRMLLGYGVMLALFTALALLFILRTNSLNARIRSLSAEIATEATVGTHLANVVAATQQAVDRYLQQPLPDNLRTATDAQQRLAAAIQDARAALVSPQQHSRIDDLGTRLATYQRSFQTLNGLLETQRTTQTRLNANLSDAITTLNGTISIYLHSSSPDSVILARFASAQQHLQLATVWSVRLISEGTEAHGQRALNELDVSEFLLKSQRDRSNEHTRKAIELLLVETQLCKSAITEYTANLAQIRQQRNTLLNEQGGQLQSQADAIAGTALDRLATTTSDLEQQSQGTQQLTVAALVLTLIVTAAFGWFLPRTITRPLMELVAATRRLKEGDYDVVVATRDGGEIGELAAVFNQTTAALSEQRDEVWRQQIELADQNWQLEHALEELRASTVAREQLAVAVRTLSVPVLPILEDVLLIPLVGEIDAKRAQMLLERLLEGISTQRARVAILDITGVPVVDVSLVDWLIRAASAAQLMGARCILVGIGPEVAQALVASGANLENLTTRTDLRDAVARAARSSAIKQPSHLAPPTHSTIIPNPDRER